VLDVHASPNRPGLGAVVEPDELPGRLDLARVFDSREDTHHGAVHLVAANPVGHAALAHAGLHGIIEHNCLSFK